MEYPIIHYPANVKKYTGNIEIMPLKSNTNSYRLTIKSRDVFYRKNFKSYEEAFAMLKAKNLEYDLPIKNKIFEHEDGWRVELTRKMYCRFDIEDREIVESYVWSFHKTGYAEAHVGERNRKMHTLIMNHDSADGTSVDHINRDGLDNRKVNLRIANQRLQNLNKNPTKSNKTGIVGVCYIANPHPRWVATWVEIDGSIRTKSFSVGKYGFDEAKQMAVDQRRLAERMLPLYIEAREW